MEDQLSGNFILMFRLDFHRSFWLKHERYFIFSGHFASLLSDYFLSFS